MRLAGDVINEVDERGEPIIGDTLLLLINAHWEEIPFTLPETRVEHVWETLVDTARPGRRRCASAAAASSTRCSGGRWRCSARPCRSTPGNSCRSRRSRPAEGSPPGDAAAAGLAAARAVRSGVEEWGVGGAVLGVKKRSRIALLPHIHQL